MAHPSSYSFPWASHSSPKHFDTTKHVKSPCSTLQMAAQEIHARLVRFYKNTVESVSLSGDKEITAQELFGICTITDDFHSILHLYSYLSLETTALISLLLSWKEEKPETKTHYWGQLPQLDKRLLAITNFLFLRLLLCCLFSSGERNRHKQISRDLLQRTMNLLFVDTLNPLHEDAMPQARRKGTKSVKKMEKVFHLFCVTEREINELKGTLIGVLSRRYFQEIVSVFYEVLCQLTHSPSLGSEVMSLMKYIYLPLESDSQVESAKQFIQLLLGNFTKDSDLAPACRNLFGESLILRADIDFSGSSYESWRSFLLGCYSEIPKQSVPIIIEIGMFCAKVSTGISFAQVYDKLYKSKKNISKEKFLRCVFFLFLHLFTAHELASEATLTQAIDKLTEVFTKKSVGQYVEHLDFLSDIAALACLFVPEAFQIFVLNLMKPENSPEQWLIAIGTFNTLADRYQITFDNTYLYISRYKTAIPTCRLQAIIDLQCSLKNNIQAENQSKFRLYLEYVLRTADENVGNMLMTRATKKSMSDSDLFLPEQMIFVKVLRVAISCVSRIPPANMKMIGLIQFLVAKSFHCAKGVAKEAKALLISFIKYRPVLRVAVTETLAMFILDFAEDNAYCIRLGLNFLRQLFSLWSDTKYLHANETDTQYIDIDIRKRTVFRASLFEAVSLVFLCYTYIGTRSDAIRLLEATSKLNQILPIHIAEPGSRVLSVITRYEQEIITPGESDTDFSCFNGSTQKPTDTSNYSLREYTMDCKGPRQIDWSHCLGRLIEVIRSSCSTAIAITFSLLSPRIERSSQFYIPAAFKSEDPILASLTQRDAMDYSSPDNLIIWRNYLLVACAIGGGDDMTFAKQAGLLYALEKTIQSMVDIVLPILFHTNTLYRNALQFSLSYCKRPFAYSIPVQLQRLIQTATTTKQTNNIQQTLGESLHLYANLALHYHKEKEINQFFVDHAITCLDSAYHFLCANSFSVSSARPLSIHALRYNFFRCCIGTFSCKSSPVLLEDSKRIDLLYFTLSHIGFGSHFQSNREWCSNISEMAERLAKLPSDVDSMETDLRRANDFIHLVANEALLSILQTVTFHNAMEDKESSIESIEKDIFEYAACVFECGEDKKIRAFARQSLIELISIRSHDNQSLLFECWIDSCYVRKDIVAQEYLRTILATVTGMGAVTMEYPLTKLLNMACFMLSASDLSIRKAAAELLHWLSTRFYRVQHTIFRLQTISQCSAQYMTQVYTIGKEFSKLHPELRFEVVEDVLVRIPTLSQGAQHRIILYLSGWLCYMDLASLDGSVMDNVLELLILLTSYYSEHQTDLLQKLWSSLASYPHNVNLIITFMIKTVLTRQNDSLLRVFQKISLFLVHEQPEPFFQRILQHVGDVSSEFEENTGRPTSIRSTIPVTRSASMICFNDLFPVIEQKVFTAGSFSVVILGEIILVDIVHWKNDTERLFLAALLRMDHPKAIVYESAKILLQNLLFMLSAHVACDVRSDVLSYQRIVGLVSTAKSLWQLPMEQNYHEDMASAAALSEVVTLCVKFLSFRDSFASTLADIAIRQACKPIHCHYICRTLKVFRASVSSCTPHILTMLTRVLANEVDFRGSKVRIRTSAEVIATLSCIIGKVEGEILKTLPDLFWIGVCLLYSSIRQEYLSGVSILSDYIKKIDFFSARTRADLEQSMPATWKRSGSFPGLFILLFKGISSKEQSKASRVLMSRLLLQPPSILLDIHMERNYLTLIISFLPYIFSSLSSPVILRTLTKFQNAMVHANLNELACVFQEAKLAKGSIGSKNFLSAISNAIASHFFPEYELFVFTLLITMLQNSGDDEEKVILEILEALLYTVDFAVSSLSSHAALFVPVLHHMNGNACSFSGFHVIKSIIYQADGNDDILYGAAYETLDSSILKYNWDSPTKNSEFYLRLRDVLHLGPKDPIFAAQVSAKPNTPARDRPPPVPVRTGLEGAPIQKAKMVPSLQRWPISSVSPSNSVRRALPKSRSRSLLNSPVVPKRDPIQNTTPQPHSPLRPKPPPRRKV